MITDPKATDVAGIADDKLATIATDPGPGLAGDIALCLSGGGYRAAAFHLGVLDLLDRVSLLDRVRTLSTISGGTIVGAAWVLSRARQEAFPVFRGRIAQVLRQRNVVRDAVARLATTADGPGAPSPSLIRAAASIYAAPDFFGDATLGSLGIEAPTPTAAGTDHGGAAESSSSTSGPDDVVFSATEFHSGLAYRFQLSRRSQVHVGNRAPIDVPAKVARQIRLADVVAASSCFPAAFEPLRFPADFGWDDPAAVRDELGPDFPDVPLMDGGIYDNQGVDGARLVYARSGMLASLGVLLVSDTSQRREPLLSEPPATRGLGWRVSTVLAVARLGTWLSAASAAALGWRTVTGILGSAALPGLLLTAAFPALLTGSTAVILFLGHQRLQALVASARSAAGVDLPPAILELRVRDLVDLAARRLASLIAMTSQVSMKRVRRLIQDSLMSATSLVRPRVVLNLLYDLDRERTALYDRQPWLRPSGALRALAARAESVPTTLWLTDDTQLRDLVACGQATTCFNLLEHLCDRRPSDTGDPSSAHGPEVEALRGLWERLQSDPYALAPPASRPDA